MKRILYIGSDAPDKNAAGLRIFYNSLALSNYGYQVDIASYSKDVNGFENSIFRGINIFKIPYPSSKKDYLDYLFFAKKIKNIIDNYGPYDCVIAYELPALSYNCLRKMCNRNHSRIICDCAEWHTAMHLHGISRLIKKIDIFLAMKYLYKKCDGMIVISSFLNNHFKIKNSIIIPPLQECRHLKKSINEGKTVFVYAGSPGVDKDNLEKIIRAFLTIDANCELHIFGQDLSSFIKQYHGEKGEFINKINKKNIIFHGFVERDEIINFYKYANFSIILREPTRRNNAGFPTKFAESICCSTPVICNDFSDLKQYLDKYDLGVLIQSFDDDTIRDCFISAINLSINDVNKKIANCDSFRLFDYSFYSSSLGSFVDGILKLEF